MELNKKIIKNNNYLKNLLPTHIIIITINKNNKIMIYKITKTLTILISKMMKKIINKILSLTPILLKVKME